MTMGIRRLPLIAMLAAWGVPLIAQAQPNGYRSATSEQYVGAWENSSDTLGGHRLFWSYVVITPDGRIGRLNSEAQIPNATKSRLIEILDNGASPGITISPWAPVSFFAGRIDVAGGMYSGGQSFVVWGSSNEDAKGKIFIGQLLRVPPDWDSSRPFPAPPLRLIDYRRLPD